MKQIDTFSIGQQLYQLEVLTTDNVYDPVTTNAITRDLMALTALNTPEARLLGEIAAMASDNVVYGESRPWRRAAADLYCVLETQAIESCDYTGYAAVMCLDRLLKGDGPFTPLMALASAVHDGHPEPLIGPFRNGLWVKVLICSGRLATGFPVTVALQIMEG